MRTLIAVASVAGAVALAAPAVAGAHAVVSPLQPQGSALTGARQLYVLRVPTEGRQPTWKVVLRVPAAVQDSFAVRTAPGWRVDLTRVPTGRRDEDGEAVLRTTKVTWTARSAASEIGVGSFDDLVFRFQNPATPGNVCFAVTQQYRKDARHRAGGEVVRWTGGPTSDTPASCVAVTAAPAS
jgi:uncharacterized protein YcnI